MNRSTEAGCAIRVRILQEIRMGGGLNQITFWGVFHGERNAKSALFLTFNPLWQVHSYLPMFKLERGNGNSVLFEAAELAVREGGLELITAPDERLRIATFDDYLGFYASLAISAIHQFGGAQLQPRLL